MRFVGFVVCKLVWNRVGNMYERATNRNFWSFTGSSLWGGCSGAGAGGKSSSSRWATSLSSTGPSPSWLSLLPFLWKRNEKLLRNFCNTLSCWLEGPPRRLKFPATLFVTDVDDIAGAFDMCGWDASGIDASVSGCSKATLTVSSSPSSSDHRRLYIQNNWVSWWCFRRLFRVYWYAISIPEIQFQYLSNCIN